MEIHNHTFVLRYSGGLNDIYQKRQPPSYAAHTRTNIAQFSDIVDCRKFICYPPEGSQRETGASFAMKT